jgi:hypothetical protein
LGSIPNSRGFNLLPSCCLIVRAGVVLYVRSGAVVIDGRSCEYEYIDGARLAFKSCQGNEKPPMDR